MAQSVHCLKTLHALHIIGHEPCDKGFDEVTCETFNFLIEALQWFCLPENNDLIWHPLHADARSHMYTHTHPHSFCLGSLCSPFRWVKRSNRLFFRSVEWWLLGFRVYWFWAIRSSVHLLSTPPLCLQMNCVVSCEDLFRVHRGT